MICTKAYIKAIPEEGSNIFKVEVPLMEDNTGTEAIFDALLCTVPGHYKGLEVGDTVFIEFEDDQYNTAIILGELFTEIPTKSTTYSIINDLKVTDTASLPPNTRFGDYTAQDIMNLYNKGGGAGTINDDDLKQYVQWINTETTTSEGDIIDVYADKIRVMSGQEYDALIEELGSEGVEEDINFINTLHFLWSIPGTDPTGGDDEGGGGGGDDPTPGPEPEPEVETYSYKKLVDFMKTKFYNNFDSATSLNQITGVSLNKWFYSVLYRERSERNRYRYNADFISWSFNLGKSGEYWHWMDKEGSTKIGPYSQFYENLAVNKSNDWNNVTGELKKGDILSFIDSSNQYKFVALYVGTVAGTEKVCMCGDCFNNTNTTVNATLKTIDEIYNLTSTKSYKITRYKNDPSQ